MNRENVLESSIKYRQCYALQGCTGSLFLHNSVLQVPDFMISITTTSMGTMPALSGGGTGCLAQTSSGENFVLLERSKLQNKTRCIIRSQFIFCFVFCSMSHKIPINVDVLRVLESNISKLALSHHCGVHASLLESSSLKSI